jgi:hypothetical protein
VTLTLTLWVSATTQLGVLTLTSTGPGEVLPVNLTLWANGNTVGLPVTTYCNDTATVRPAYAREAALPAARLRLPVV